jgi:hypothetical protein
VQGKLPAVLIGKYGFIFLRLEDDGFQLHKKYFSLPGVVEEVFEITARFVRRENFERSFSC